MAQRDMVGMGWAVELWWAAVLIAKLQYNANDCAVLFVNGCS